MPLPLLPFAIKGAIVVAKVLATKGAAAKATAVVAKTAVSTLGPGATATLAVAGLATVGGIAWSVEQVRRGRRAYDLASSGDLSGAARNLGAMAISLKTVGTSSFGDELTDWVSDGSPLDYRVVQLSRQAKNLADEAMETHRLTE